MRKTFTLRTLILLTIPCISPLAAQQRIVDTVTPEIKTILVTTTQPVTLEAFHMAEMGTRVSGVVDEVAVDIGQPVEKNAVLARLAVPELEAQQDALIAERRVTETRVTSSEAYLQSVISETERILELVETGSITDKAGHEATRKLASARADHEAATASLEAMSARLTEIQERIAFATIRAPFNGIVTYRGIDPGDLVQADRMGMHGQPLFSIMQTDTLRAVLYVPEKDTPLLDVGDPVILNFDALRNLRIEASISRMAMALDPKTQRMRVEADIEARNSKLRPGFYGSAEIIMEERSDAVTVPAGAIRFNGKSPMAYGVSNGKIVYHPIEIGVDHGAWVEVVSGLRGDEKVVIGMVDRLPEGTAVTIR